MSFFGPGYGPSGGSGGSGGPWRGQYPSFHQSSSQHAYHRPPSSSTSRHRHHGQSGQQHRPLAPTKSAPQAITTLRTVKQTPHSEVTQDIPTDSNTAGNISSRDVHQVVTLVEALVQAQVVSNVQIEEFAAVLSSMRDQFLCTQERNEYLQRLENILREIIVNDNNEELIHHQAARILDSRPAPSSVNEMDPQEQIMLYRLCDRELRDLQKNALTIGHYLKDLNTVASRLEGKHPHQSDVDNSNGGGGDNIVDGQALERMRRENASLEVHIDELQEQIHTLKRALEQAQQQQQSTLTRPASSSRAMSFEETYARYFGGEEHQSGDQSHSSAQDLRHTGDSGGHGVEVPDDDDDDDDVNDSDDEPIIIGSPHSSGRSTPVKSPRSNRSSHTPGTVVASLPGSSEIKLRQTPPPPRVSQELAAKPEYNAIVNQASDSFVIESNMIRHAHQIEVERLQQMWHNKEKQWEQKVDTLSQQLFQSREVVQATRAECDALQVQVHDLNKLLKKRISSEEQAFREREQRAAAAHRDELEMVRRETRQLQVDLKHEIRILQQRNSSNERKLIMLRDTDEISDYVSATNSSPLVHHRAPNRPRSAKTRFINAPLNLDNVKAKIDTGATKKTPKNTGAAPVPASKNPAMTKPKHKLKD